MATATLLRAGWKLMPDRRTVTFKKRTATTPTYTSYTVADAWYRPDGVEEGGPSQGVYLKRFRRWFLVKEKLSGAGVTTDPVAGDVVTNTTSTIDPVAGEWTVTRTGEAGALGAWELSCVLLEVRSALAVSLAVKRLSGAKDATGRLLPTQTTVTTVSGWLQADGSETVTDLLMKMQMPTRGIVYLPTTVTVLGTDTVTVGSTTYNVDATDNPNRLDELQTLTVSLAR